MDRIFGYGCAAILIAVVSAIWGSTGIFVLLGILIAFHVWYRVTHGCWLDFN